MSWSAIRVIPNDPNARHSDAASLVDLECQANLLVHHRRFRLHASQIVTVRLVERIDTLYRPRDERGIEWPRLGDLDPVADGLLRDTVDAFNVQVRQNRSFRHGDRENRLSARSFRVARDLHVIELPRRENRSNRTLNVAVIERSAANQAGVAPNQCLVDLVIAADGDGIRHGAATGLLGVLSERRSARCCQTQQQEGQSTHGGNIHESTRRVQRADGCYPLLQPNLGRSRRRRL